MLLAENRLPFGKIYVPEKDFENYGSQIWFVASQLRYYLARITLAPFEIDVEKFENGIHIDIDTSYAQDEFSIATKNGSLYINGGTRGVIYGAYELLEIIGCRFFTPECEKIPTITKLEIPNLNRHETPVFEYRETDYTTAVNYPKFATMCRVNGGYNHIPQNMGGHIQYALGAHSFEVLISPDKYFENHPEYYALFNGKRDAGRHTVWQPCLTNPDVLDVVVQNVRKILKENPNKKIISISQNDNNNHCQCENCVKSDIEEGSPAGTLIKFVNRVAEILEPEFPDVTFDILAYHYTRPASKKTQTRHNVCVRLCASNTCFAHSYEECNDRSRAASRPDGSKTVFVEDLVEWSKVCNRLYVWDYTSNFPLYLMPFPNWRVLQPNLQTLAKNNVRGVFEEANRAVNGGADFNELRNYLLCKLMWNPNCDINAYRKEFMEYFYGEAAPYLNKYLDIQSDFVEQENYHLYIQEIKRPDYLTNDYLKKYYDLFDKAEKAVSGDGIRLVRVQRARLSVRFADVYWNEIIDKGYNAEKINQFFTDLRAHNISRLDEWSNIERTYRAWMDGKKRGVDYSWPFKYDAETVL